MITSFWAESDAMAVASTNGSPAPKSAGTSHPLPAVQELFIVGKHRPSSDGSVFPVNNPMTGETVYHCADATADAYRAANPTAQSAYELWSQTGPSARRAVFLRAADIIETYLGADAPEILRSEV